MARKKKEEDPLIPSEALLKFREKRKWQISLRRYVLDRHICADYAPYFGLDIENIRQWFEYQFKKGVGWENFGKLWQFDHIIPVIYFDFSNDDELKLCWNFINLRVEEIKKNTARGHRLDVLAAKNFFTELYQATQYLPCKKMLEKIDKIEFSEFVSTEPQQAFLKSHMDYLKLIEGYSHFEFELLNRGRGVDEVKKEIEFLKRFNKGL